MAQTNEGSNHVEAAPRGAAAKLEAVLAELAAEYRGEDPPRATFGKLFDKMEERAYGLLLLLLALPCGLPFVYGLPQIVAFPMLLLAGQMAIGRNVPWLPQSLRDKSFDIGTASNVVRRAHRYLALAEWLAHPRIPWLTDGVFSRFAGALLLIPCASVLVPLPLTNTVPGIAVAIASIGLIERDGLLLVFGIVAGIFWVALLLFGGHAAVSAIFDLLSG